ncbi:Uncharacterised protein [Acinetobacter baumannii]|nr:Uncharacterised protein [Acinetobacter baumannii]
MFRAVAHVIFVKHVLTKTQPELQGIAVGPILIFQGKRRAGHIVVGFKQRRSGAIGQRQCRIAQVGLGKGNRHRADPQRLHHLLRGQLVKPLARVRRRGGNKRQRALINGGEAFAVTQREGNHAGVDMPAKRKCLPLFYRHRVADIDRFLIAAARHQDAPQHQQRQKVIHSPYSRALFQRFPLRFGHLETQLGRLIVSHGAAFLKGHVYRAQIFRFGPPVRQRSIGGQLFHLVLQLPIDGGNLGRLEACR